MIITHTSFNCEFDLEDASALNTVYKLLDDIYLEMHDSDTLFANGTDYDIDDLRIARSLIYDLYISKKCLVDVDRS